MAANTSPESTTSPRPAAPRTRAARSTRSPMTPLRSTRISPLTTQARRSGLSPEPRACCAARSCTAAAASTASVGRRNTIWNESPTAEARRPPKASQGGSRIPRNTRIIRAPSAYGWAETRLPSPGTSIHKSVPRLVDMARHCSDGRCREVRAVFPTRAPWRSWLGADYKDVSWPVIKSTAPPNTAATEEEHAPPDRSRRSRRPLALAARRPRAGQARRRRRLHLQRAGRLRADPRRRGQARPAHRRRRALRRAGDDLVGQRRRPARLRPARDPGRAHLLRGADRPLVLLQRRRRRPRPRRVRLRPGAAPLLLRPGSRRPDRRRRDARRPPGLADLTLASAAAVGAVDDSGQHSAGGGDAAAVTGAGRVGGEVVLRVGLALSRGKVVGGRHRARDDAAGLDVAFVRDRVGALVALVDGGLEGAVGRDRQIHF